MKEIWKDIKGYEGFYQISNYGRVKRLNKWCGNCHSGRYVDDIKILKPTDNGNGYLIIGLKKYGTRKNYYVHRLVATYFLENPHNKKIINHKDFNRHNNNVTNLEWVTQKENIIYSLEHYKVRKKVTHSNTGEKYITYRDSKQVYRVVIDKKEYGSFKSLNEAIQKRDEILKGVVKYG